MGPSEHRSTDEKNQACCIPAAGEERKRARRPRMRACLLKECEQRFRPVHPLTRYCSEECREQARRWREWKARRQYRQSEAGKQKRRAQSRRYRLRCQRARAANHDPGKTREGHRKKKYFAVVAIGLAAMRNSSRADAHPCSDFVRTFVGEPWSGFWSESGAGGSDPKTCNEDRRNSWQPDTTATDRAEIVLRYCASSGCLHMFALPKQKRKGERSRA